MTQLEKIKHEAMKTLQSLCAKCKKDIVHSCRVGRLISEIEDLNGIPVIVNENLYHVVFN